MGKAARVEADSFEDNRKKQCRESGDYCTLIEKTSDGDCPEHICLPEECHGHAELVALDATDLLQKEPGCSDCFADVVCTPGLLSEAETEPCAARSRAPRHNFECLWFVVLASSTSVCFLSSQPSGAHKDSAC